MNRTEAPHLAIIDITIEIHDLLNTGECSGHAIPEKELLKHGIKSNQLLSVQGANKKDCIDKLKKKIKEFQNV